MFIIKQHLSGTPQAYYTLKWQEGSETIRTANSKSLSYIQKLRKEWQEIKARSI